MAAESHQLGLRKGPEEKEWQYPQKQDHLPLLCVHTLDRKPGLKHQEDLWVAQEPTTSTGLPISTHAQLGGLSKHKGTALLPLPLPQNQELCKRNHTGTHGRAAAFVSSLRTCTKSQDLHRGSRLHDDILRRGLLDKCSDALVVMYAKCGALVKAKQLLDMHNCRNVSSWTALISAYTRQGQSNNALNCFERMQCEGVSPNAVTFACTLKACGNIKAAEKGKQIHKQIARQGLLGKDVVLGTVLVDMYAKCGALAKARSVLDELPSRDVVSWNTLIAAYSQQGQGEQALDCFVRMQHEGVFPDTVTFCCILKVCGMLGASDKGEQIHDEIMRQGLVGHNVVLGTALVDMYAKCGALSKAQCVLEELTSRDVVSWNALIAGYAQQGQGEQALKCFERMRCEGLSPDGVTFASVLKACGTLGAIRKGEQFHDEIARQGLLANNSVLGTALVDMYAKCGAFTIAERVFDELPSRDVAVWTALISGYAQQGEGEQALNSFDRMQREGIPPNVVTICCVLNVCSHLGLVEDGYRYFVDIITKYGMKLDVELYTCMIDLFGRVGHFEKALEVIQKMPSYDHSEVWHALLGACRKWGEVNVGRWAFEQAIKVDKSDGPAYVLMANIYAAAGMQEKAKNIEEMRKGNKAWKNSDIVCGFL